MNNLFDQHREQEGIDAENAEYKCEVCKDVGYTFTKFGEVRTCIECLNAGRLG